MRETSVLNKYQVELLEIKNIPKSKVHCMRLTDNMIRNMSVFKDVSVGPIQTELRNIKV